MIQLLVLVLLVVSAVGPLLGFIACMRTKSVDELRRTVVAIAVGLALIVHIFVEWDPEGPGADGPANAAIVAACGFLGILVVASTRSSEASPWV